MTLAKSIIEAQAILREQGISLERVEMTRASLDQLAKEVGCLYKHSGEYPRTPVFLGIDIAIHE